MGLSTQHGAQQNNEFQGLAILIAIQNPNSKIQNLLLCLLITTGAILPFANKAIHIDDPYYIWVAQHILQDPFDYYGLSINWYGRPLPVYEMHVSPPLFPYYLAIWGSLFGWGEYSLHIAMIPFSLLFTGATFALAQRFSKAPCLAVFLTVLSPLFLVTATNIMLDLPMTAFFVVAIAAWCKGIDERLRGYLALGAAMAGLSALCKYFGIAAVPLLCVYAVTRRHSTLRWAPFLVIPLAMFSTEQVATYMLYGRSLFANAVDIAATASNPAVYRIATALSFTGGCMIGALAFSWHLRPRRNRAATYTGIAALTGIGVAIIIALNPSEDGLPTLSALQLCAFVLGGVIVLAVAAGDLYTNRSADSAILFCWVMGTFGFAALMNWSVTARTLLPLAPPAALLIARRVSAQCATVPTRFSMYAAPLVACAGISIACGVADYVWAGSIRDTARAFASEAKKQTGTTYFQGHWGWQYYLEQAGLKPLDTTNASFRPGDFILSPQNNVNVEQIPARYADDVRTTSIPTTRGLSVMSHGLGAGYYSDLFGPLPFVFGGLQIDQYHVILLGY